MLEHRTPSPPTTKLCSHIDCIIVGVQMFTLACWENQRGMDTIKTTSASNSHLCLSVKSSCYFLQRNTFPARREFCVMWCCSRPRVSATLVCCSSISESAILLQQKLTYAQIYSRAYPTCFMTNICLGFPTAQPNTQEAERVRQTPLERSCRHNYLPVTWSKYDFTKLFEVQVVAL